MEGNDNACIAELFATALTNATYTYIAYIDSVRKDFQDAWMTKCMNVQPYLTMKADLYEYHYTLYYYDQSGNLVKTVPPEGVEFLDDESINELQAIRNNTDFWCSNNNSMVFTGGSINFPGGSINAPQLSMGANPFTIETWINLSNYNDQGILSNNTFEGGFPPHNKGYTLEIIDNKLNILIGGSAFARLEAESPLLNGFLPLNTWAHIAMQRTGLNSIRMFINGNEIPVTYNAVSPLFTVNADHTDTDPFYVGASNRNGGVSALSSGKLRHVRLYKRVLPPGEIRQNYMNYCGNPASDEALVFWEPFTEGEWTVNGGNDYVYDRIYRSAGGSSGAVAFETDVDNSLIPEHRLATTYQYNSLNQVLQQYSPDGDTSVFFYDRLGHLTASQNKEQKENVSYSGPAGRFSYTLYDSLGRITLVGEKSTTTDIRTINMLKQDSVIYWLGLGTNKQITKTIYDNPINLYQNFGASRKRVIASIYLENESDAEGDSTLYSYDINGNVKTLVQHIKALVAEDNANGKKQIGYDYDLVSGKVNMVSYQNGKGDQFFYKYHYDADNRVTRAYRAKFC